jgi:phosphoribosylaminoimidazole carboxylase PurE protein
MEPMSRPVVALLMGSKSDLPKLQIAIDVFSDFGIAHTVRVMSAHRTPDAVMEFASSAASNGYKVLIAAAGGAAHLAGVVAAHTSLPVIGIPVAIAPFEGLDSLLATVQMPGGVPVATVGAGSGGAKNAALLAARILALGDTAVAANYEKFVAAQSTKVKQADDELQAELGN